MVYPGQAAGAKDGCAGAGDKAIVCFSPGSGRGRQQPRIGNGVQPFALPKDKELVLLLAEGNGARELVMAIGEKELLKVRRYEQE